MKIGIPNYDKGNGANNQKPTGKPIKPFKR